MSTRQDLIDRCNRMLWLDREMQRTYMGLAGLLSDKELLNAIKEMQADEARHVNMEERILSILSK